MAKKNPTASVPSEEMDLASPEVLSAELKYICSRLRTVFAVVSTTANALQYCNIEHNPDFAMCLQQCALDPLDEEMSHIQSMLKRLDPSHESEPL